MKKNKRNIDYRPAEIWGTPFVLPAPNPRVSVFVPLFGRYWVFRLCFSGYLALGRCFRRYWPPLILFGGYAVLFYLPFEYPVQNAGAYLAAVLMAWPLIVAIIPAIIEEYNRFKIKRKQALKDWHYLTMTIDKKGFLRGELRHNNQTEDLSMPMQYQYFYIKTGVGEAPGFQVFIHCADRENKQIILSATVIWLPEKCKHAVEITNIPAEWHKMLFLKCNPKYLHGYLRLLTKLEAKAAIS